MSTPTDRYCPHCFRNLREGRKNWLWCPNDYYCGYECDIGIKDTTLGKRDARLGRLAKLEAEYSDAKARYEQERDLLLAEIENLKSKCT